MGTNLDSVARLGLSLVGLDDVTGKVLVGCSGGADSIALLALTRLAGFDCVAAYVDHGLRDAARGEADLVRRVARSVGAGFVPLSVAIEPGTDLESRARDARYQALDKARVDHEAEVIAVGHTADDQAETVLLDLLRGGALGALSGMPIARGLLRRPLLRLRRADTLQVCARLGVVPADDAMNHDRSFRRVWVRRRLLPELRAAADRDVVAVLARQADIAAAEQETLDALGAARLAEAGVSPGGESEAPNAELIAADPIAIARRAVRRWLGAPWPTYDEVDRVLAVAKGRARRAQLSRGRSVERAAGRLHLLQGDLPVPVPVRLAVPGSVRFGDRQVEAWIDHSPPVAWPDGRDVCVVDADRVGDFVELRPARNGDRIRPLGMSGSKSVSSVLAEAGVPSLERPRAPVVTATAGSVVPAGEPIWIVGYRIDDRVRVQASTKRFGWFAVHDALGQEAS